MKKKQLLAALLAFAMAMPAAGCTAEDWNAIINGFSGGGVSQTDDGIPRAEVSEEEAAVYVEDAAHIFNHLTYTPEMFYGKYVADGTVNTELTEEARQRFLEENDTFNITGDRARLTVMPYRIDFGPHCNVTPLNYLSGYEWAQLYYYDSRGNPVQVQAAYTVDGNCLNMQLIKSFDYDSAAGTLDYTFSGDTVKYYYTLDGSGLALSNSTGSVQLYPEDLRQTPPAFNIFDANLVAESPMLDGIETINLTAEEQYVIVEGQQYPVDAYEMNEEGIFKLKWTVNDVPHAVQTAYFYCDDNGLILFDDENTYRYIRRSNDLYDKKVTTNISVADNVTLQQMSDAEINALQTQISDLYADLEDAFQKAGVNATVNQETGEIALDSVVLFAVDDYFISAEGQEMLSHFLQAYTSVIFSEKYDGFVSSIAIEGHTDPTGLVEHNQILSQARAEQVMAYCISPESGLDEASIAKLQPMLSAVGYASMHPVFGADGSVDLEASRRVSFRFIINVGGAAE